MSTSQTNSTKQDSCRIRSGWVSTQIALQDDQFLHNHSLVGTPFHRMACQESRLFQSFRTIGMITDDIPFSLVTCGSDNFITVSIGKAFQVYNCEKMVPSIVSPLMTKKIRAIAARKDQITFTSSGKDILVWKRVKQRTVLKGHSGRIMQVQHQQKSMSLTA